MPTHALAVLGAGPQLANTPTVLGAVQLMPAGGPWIIHDIWSTFTVNSPTVDEGITGDLLFNSVSGDISPDPAPARYPIIGTSGAIGAAIPLTETPTAIFPVNWTASGKAQFSLAFNINLAVTNAPQAAAGIIFGDSIPERRPLTFVDMVDSFFAGGAEAAVGTITVAEKATRIIGLLGLFSKTGAVVAEDAITGVFRLDSNDVQLPPARYPFNHGFNGMLGAATFQTTAIKPDFIPVDIPVIGGSNINVFVETVAAVANNVSVRVYVAYE